MKVLPPNTARDCVKTPKRPFRETKKWSSDPSPTKRMRQIEIVEVSFSVEITKAEFLHSLALESTAAPLLPFHHHGSSDTRRALRRPRQRLWLSLSRSAYPDGAA